MKQRIAALVGALLALVLTAPAAMAGTLCNWSGICGDVYNNSRSVTGILATNNWPAENGSWQRVAPGYRCTFKDCDGFYIPSGHWAFYTSAKTYGAGWHKITDDMNVELLVFRN